MSLFFEKKIRLTQDPICFLSGSQLQLDCFHEFHILLDRLFAFCIYKADCAGMMMMGQLEFFICMDGLEEEIIPYFSSFLVTRFTWMQK